VTASYIRSFFTDMGVPVSTARSGNVIGGGDFAENRLIPDCYRAAAKREIINIRNPASVRPYQHVLDTLFVYLLIARRQYEDPSLAGSYNIGPEESDCATSGDLTELFCGAWGKPARWEHAPAEAPQESGLLKLDCSKIREVLEWRPRWNIGQAVSETVKWYKALGDGTANAVMTRQIEAFMEQNDEK
jgi:CDP-glucose 4,6-dehydratase